MWFQMNTELSSEREAAIEEIALTLFRSSVADILEAEYENTDEFLFTWLRGLDVVHEYIRGNEMYTRALRYLVFINIPKTGLPLLKILMRTLSEHQQNSVKVFGTDRMEWSEFLLRFISSNHLAREFGGTRTLQTTSIYRANDIANISNI